MHILFLLSYFSRAYTKPRKSIRTNENTNELSGLNLHLVLLMVQKLIPATRKVAGIVIIGCYSMF